MILRDPRIHTNGPEDVEQNTTLREQIRMRQNGPEWRKLSVRWSWPNSNIEKPMRPIAPSHTLPRVPGFADLRVAWSPAHRKVIRLVDLFLEPEPASWASFYQWLQLWRFCSSAGWFGPFWDFFQRLGRVFPTDELIFFGVEATNHFFDLCKRGGYRTLENS